MFMKMKKRLIIIAITVLPVYVQAQFSAERQPFSGNNHSQMQRSPGDELPNDNTGGGPFVGGGTGGGGPWDDLPNDDEGGGGWVGQAPVKETTWILLLLAIGYGVIRRRRPLNPLKGI